MGGWASYEDNPYRKAPISNPLNVQPIDKNPVVGENLFLTNTLPIHQNDNVAVKAGKGLVNSATSVLAAPGELLRHISIEGNNIITGQGGKEIAKNTSFTEDILPSSVSSGLNNFSNSHPILGGLSRMGIETVVDPTMYTGLGGAKTVLPVNGELGTLTAQEAERFGNAAARADKLQANADAAAQNKYLWSDLGKKYDLAGQEYGKIEPDLEFFEGADDLVEFSTKKTDFTADQFGNIHKGEPQAQLPAGQQPLMLPEGNRPLALTGQQPLMLPEGKIPNWEYWKDRSTPTGNPPIELGPNFYADQYGNIRTSPGVSPELPAGRPETPAINLQGKKGNMTYPSQSILDSIIQRGQEASQNMAIKNEAYSNPNALHAIARDPLDDFKDLALIGAGKLAKGVKDFSAWSKEMIAEHGQIIEKQLPYLWNRSVELFKNGETKVKYGGRELPLKWQDEIRPQTNGMAHGDINAQSMRLDLSQSAGVGNTVKTLPNGQREMGISANTRTNINNPQEMRTSFEDDPLIYTQLSNKETLAKAQSIMDGGFENARTQFADLNNRMQPEAVPLGMLMARQMTEAGNIAGAREIISEVADKALQAGQFGQAARILRTADPETFLLTMDKQLKKLNEEGIRTYGKDWKKVDLTPQEMEGIKGIKRGDQKSYENVQEQIRRRIADELPASAMEKINAWRHMSMLLNPKTQIRNVGGNAIMLGMRRSAKQVSAILQNIILPAEARTQVWQIKPEYQGAAEAYFEANKKDLLARGNKYQDSVRLNMPDKRVFQTDALENTRKLTYNMLQMGDVPFYKNAYVNRLASYAQAKGIKDFNQLPQEAFDIARKEAEQATYKDASKLASYLNRVKNPGANATLGDNTKALLAEAAMPFTKTPINIAKRGIQYSPAGIVNGLNMWKSQKLAAEGIDEMAKGLTGTAIMGLGYLLARHNILTGNKSKDKDIAAYESATGKNPFSIMGKYSYDWAMPFAIPLSIGVEIYNSLKETPAELAKMDEAVNDQDVLTKIAVTASGSIYDALAAYADTTFNMSVMKGLKTVIGNQGGITAGLMTLPQNYATQFVPTVARQTAGLIDPVVRQSYVNNNIPASMKTGIVSGIPFASKLTDAKQTPFGTDMQRVENPIGRALTQYVSPGTVSVDQGIDKKVDTEIQRLIDQGYKNHVPTQVPNYIPATKQHPKIELSQQETTEYQRKVGELTLKSFQTVMKNATYLSAGDEEKAKTLADMIANSKAQAKEEILKNKGYKTAPPKANNIKPADWGWGNTTWDKGSL